MKSDKKFILVLIIISILALILVFKITGIISSKPTENIASTVQGNEEIEKRLQTIVEQLETKYSNNKDYIYFQKTIFDGIDISDFEIETYPGNDGIHLRHMETNNLYDIRLDQNTKKFSYKLIITGAEQAEKDNAHIKEIRNTNILFATFAIASIVVVIGMYKLFNKLSLNRLLNKSILLLPLSFVLVAIGLYFKLVFLGVIGAITFWISGILIIFLFGQYFRAIGISSLWIWTILLLGLVCELIAKKQSNIRLQFILVFLPLIMFEILYIISSIKLSNMFNKGKIFTIGFIVLIILIVGTFIFKINEYTNIVSQYRYFEFEDFLKSFGILAVLISIPFIFQAYLGYNKNELP